MGFGFCMKHVPPRHGIEGRCEHEFAKLGLHEPHVGYPKLLRTVGCHRQDNRRAIHADDLAGWPDQTCSQKRDIPCATIHIEHAPTKTKASVMEVLRGERFIEACLCTEPFQLLLRVAQ